MKKTQTFLQLTGMSQEIYDKRDQMIGGKESKMKSTPRIEMGISWTAEATLRGMLKESGVLFMS